MCIAWIAYQVHPIYHIVIAANRDEFFSRPTAAAAYWSDPPGIAGGRDLKDQGTWFAADLYGRLGLLTNHRNFSLHKEAQKSRGVLIPAFLREKTSAEIFLKKTSEESENYNPYNLMVMDQSGLYYFDNVNRNITALSPGIYGLSNGFLDTPWPKLLRGKDRFEKILLDTPGSLSPENFISLLRDPATAPDHALPSTGLTLEMERQLSSIYIDAGHYGTRAHTVYLQTLEGEITLYERSMLPASEKPRKNPLWRETLLKYKQVASV